METKGNWNYSFYITDLLSKCNEEQKLNIIEILKFYAMERKKRNEISTRN